MKMDGWESQPMDGFYSRPDDVAIVTMPTVDGRVLVWATNFEEAKIALRTVTHVHVAHAMDDGRVAHFLERLVP
jgi:hypothetical protein